MKVGDEALPSVVDGDAVETGLDLGLAALVVDEHGRVIKIPRFLHRAERKLKWAQRVVSCTQQGSHHRTKARRKLARQYATVTDTSSEGLHQETSRLVGKHPASVLEGLAVSGLARTRLAHSVHQASWATFRRLLSKKSTRYDRDLVVINR